MSFRERFFIDQLYKDAKLNLAKIMEKRRHTFWGETPILFRVRKYKVAGEVRDQRVSVVKPQLHKLKLYSKLLKKFVPLEATPQMLRYIEASGGLDDYLLNTPDRKLHSDVASQLKVQLMNLKHDLAQVSAKRRLLQGKKPSARPSSPQPPARPAAVQVKQPARQPAEKAAAQAQQPAQQEAGTEGSKQRTEAAVKSVAQARAELARARKERITHMLKAAAAAAAAGSEARSTAGAGLRPRLYS